LKFDAEFFGLLQGDVTNLEKLHANELRAMTDTISILSREISQVTTPGKSNKNDMETWRQLLDIYLHARIFFSTNELDAGSRSSALAARQLNWFQSEVTKLNLLRSFRQRKSGDAFVRFIDLNVTLLRNLKFQEINHLAISKILKSIFTLNRLESNTN
jgi:E3 ubiquitin-protein ligase BAH